ncbi:Hypothetical protein POVR1_LOCUS380 [uncultured virus]|nr:Hypothetical protein POVR1_LOCUS380 [uncultured virus]
MDKIGESIRLNNLIISILFLNEMVDLPHNFLIAGNEIILPTDLRSDHLNHLGAFMTQRKRRKCQPINSHQASREVEDDVLITGSINAMTLSKHVRRAGIIPYTVLDSGDVVFAFGIDQSGDYSDWGGGFSRRYDKLPILCATREFTEEILGIIDINVAELATEPCIVADHVCIFFAYLSVEKLFGLTSKFPKRVAEHNLYAKKKSEMVGVRLIFERDIFEEIDRGNIYCVISGALTRHLKNVIKIIHETSIYKI